MQRAAPPARAPAPTFLAGAGRLTPSRRPPARNGVPSGPRRGPAPPVRTPSRSTHLPPPCGLGSEEDDVSSYVRINTEPDFAAALASADVVAVDFMALWCRKCKYIKPKLATMMADKFPAVPLVFVNVNAVPASVVSGAGVTKMPTIVVYVRGEVVSSYVAGDSAAAAVIRVETDVAAATKRAKQK